MKSKILVVLLILSISVNIYLVSLISLIQPAQRTAYFESSLNSTPGPLGFAGLQAPAVMQRIEYSGDYPFVRQQVVEEGNMINISAEIRPGEGRVLVQTKPLMGTVFQDAANTAVYVAQNKTGSIDQYGHVGAIGGIIEKAKAAKESGKNLLLLPSENSKLVQHVEKTRKRAGLTITRQVPETIDAKQYIETNVGIKVEYVDNIDDILKYAM